MNPECLISKRLNFVFYLLEDVWFAVEKIYKKNPLREKLCWDFF